jgi:molecular chaperone Hsp33
LFRDTYAVSRIMDRVMRRGQALPASPPDATPPGRFWDCGARAYMKRHRHDPGTANMTLTTKIAWDDTVLPFQLDRSDIRGRVARLDQTLERVLAQHSYPPEVEAMVAEAALLTALIGQTIKLRWKLSLQVRGDGPIRLIATDFYAPAEPGAKARIRAYASYDADRLEAGADPFAQIGKGYFAILIDQGAGMVPYQGITPLAGGSLKACAEAYFAQSEQLPTRFALSYGQSQEPGAAAAWRAGGVMLQHMPKASPAVSGGGSGEGGLLAAEDLLDADEGENWNRANILLDTVEPLELIGPHVAPTDLLLRLFHEETPRVFDALPVQFGCTCSADRVRESLSIYSAKDIGHMTTDDGRVTADCQFCGAHYEFDPKTLGFEAEYAADDAAPADRTDPTDPTARDGSAD